MGNHRNRERAGGAGDGGDLETLRERVLDHPDEEEALTGNDNDATACTGPIKVVVRQDGIGRTGGIVLGIFAGCAFGMAVMTLIVALLRDADLREDLRKAQTQAALLERRYIDLESYALLNGWKVPHDDQHGPLGNLERLKGEDHVR